jgi:outer membrane immunogenic protein
MKTLTHFLIALLACAILTLTSFAGPEPIRDYKDSKDKVIAPVPAPCDWHGFYMGLHVGGQFGTSEDKDLDNYNGPGTPQWSYDESGFVAGGQLGYNWQWHMLVFGPEVDLGYMHLNGHGVEPTSPNGDTRGITDSDFYTTIRARIGVALNCNWLIYATGGGIGVNYDTRVFDGSITRSGPDLIDAHKEEMEWGYTVGAGVERKLGPHWSIKLEYLYFNLADQTLSGHDLPNNRNTTFVFNGNTEGNIVRGGVNFHF